MTYTLEIPLNTKGYDDYLAKRFKYGYKLKRELVNWFNRQEHRRRESEGYKFLAEETKSLNELQDKIKDTTDKSEKARLKEEYKEKSETLKKQWIELNNSFGLGSGKFVDYNNMGQASNMYARYSKQGIINWSTFENMAQATKQAYLKRRGQSGSDNSLKVPRTIDFTTLWYRKCNNNISEQGVAFGVRKNKFVIPWKFRKEDEVKLTYALKMQKLAMYAIKRTLVKNNTWKYSVLMVFDGVPYGVETTLKNKGLVEISLDVDTLSIVAKNQDNNIELVFDLTNDFGYSEKLSDLDRKIENSRRLNNPDNYEDNGVIKEGVRKWHKSKNYVKLLNKKRYLWHKIKSSRKQRFGEIVNGILTLGDEFVVYKEDFKSLQQRKDFDPSTMKWFDTRKQKGFEIMFNAPYEFLQVLDIKLSYLGKTSKKITK